MRVVPVFLLVIITYRAAAQNGRWNVTPSKNAIERLPALDALPERVRKSLSTLQDDGNVAYIVGGAIRDIFLKGSTDDWDIATSARPERVKELFPHNAPLGERHGSIMAIFEDGNVDITTFRTEAGYSDSRRPDAVSFVGDIEEDLSRRDFTINAMAWDPSGNRLLDPFDGLDDLRAGIIRTVGDPLLRFSEDALRMMRALRFASLLCFEIHSDTEAAIGRLSGSIGKVSAERKAVELGRMLSGPCAAKALALFVRLGLASSQFPTLDGNGLLKAAEHIGELSQKPLLRLTAFLACGDKLGPQRVDGNIRSRFDELKMPRLAKIHAAKLAESLYEGYALTDGPSIRKWAALLGWDAVEEGLELRSWYDRFIRLKKDWKDDVERVKGVLAVKPPLTKDEMKISGSDIVSLLGGKTGPMVKALMNRLYLDVLDSPELNDKEKLMLLALMYLKGDEGGGVRQ